MAVTEKDPWLHWKMGSIRKRQIEGIRLDTGKDSFFLRIITASEFLRDQHFVIRFPADQEDSMKQINLVQNWLTGTSNLSLRINEDEGTSTEEESLLKKVIRQTGINVGDSVSFSGFLARVVEIYYSTSLRQYCIRTNKQINHLTAYSENDPYRGRWLPIREANKVDSPEKCKVRIGQIVRYGSRSAKVKRTEYDDELGWKLFTDEQIGEFTEYEENDVDKGFWLYETEVVKAGDTEK